MTAREAAFVSLQKYENNKKFANIEADTAIRRNGLEGADKALYTSIFYGTVERKITLDYIIDCLCDRKREIDANVRIILRLSLYQMRYLDRVPDYAIVNDAAELCKRFAAKSAVAFVNAVLHAYRREEKRLKFPDAKVEPYRYLSVTYAYPEWLCQMWTEMYGYEKAEAIFRAFDENPPITLRINTLKTDAETLGEKFRAKTVGFRPTAYVPNGFRLTGHLPIDEIPGFAEGECFVQDEASQIAAYVLGAQKGEFIIDACSCPGGKSFSTALWMENEGKILSCDLHKNKLKLVSEGAEKLGISVIETKEQNGSVFVPEYEGKADRVLCDVPCSGLGVLSKKPDIRHKTQDEIERLPAIQYAILENCARYVKDGGILVYSTCTLNRAENEDNVNQFLAAHPEFEAVPFTVGAKTIEDGMISLFPDEYRGCDGFFVAKLRRVRGSSSERNNHE
ncbi:MAG: 16S rRNA (cytosine(967)-C(5))-methyltransferase RsmB [Clostridia bacterium]|nr:16S rRNA (cytosine(967)-C(5))-methyltransferase RsmB [Clostridia bacterium]